MLRGPGFGQPQDRTEGKPSALLGFGEWATPVPRGGQDRIESPRLTDKTSASVFQMGVYHHWKVTNTDDKISESVSSGRTKSGAGLRRVPPNLHWTPALLAKVGETASGQQRKHGKLKTAA